MSLLLLYIVYDRILLLNNKSSARFTSIGRSYVKAVLLLLPTSHHIKARCLYRDHAAVRTWSDL